MINCSSCKLCIEACPRWLLTLEDNKITCSDSKKCIACNHCKAVCPKYSSDSPTEIFYSRRSTRSFKNLPVERTLLTEIIDVGRYAPHGANRHPFRYFIIQSPIKMGLLKKLTLESMSNQVESMKKSIDQQNQLPVRVRIIKTFIDLWEKILLLSNRNNKDVIFFDAPSLVICYGNPIASLHPDMEAGLECMQMLLKAETMRLGTCLCGHFTAIANNDDEIKNFLGIGRKYKVFFSFVVGYPSVKFLRSVERKESKLRWM